MKGLTAICDVSLMFNGGYLEEVLLGYGTLLNEVDRWFSSCVRNYSGHIRCHHGCSECCRGLFDITLMDALYLKIGFDRLPGHIQSVVRSKAEARLEELSKEWPLFGPPWMLNDLPESDWNAMMPEEDEIPCVFLSEDGGCLVYDYRPMTCRLNGIPLIDTGGEELFDEWCTLNFSAIDPRALPDLRFHFIEIFAQELLLFRELTRRLTGMEINELDTIIPAACFLDDNRLELISSQLANNHP